MLILLQLPFACPRRNENGQWRWGILQRRQRSELRGYEGARISLTLRQYRLFRVPRKLDADEQIWLRCFLLGS